MASLYRKWRSRSFDDLYGQEHVVRTLRNAIKQGRVAHAYLFTGPRGTGKTSTARLLAKAVNCLNPRDGNPCNTCEMCAAANEGRAVDVIEIDAASNTSVENVRDLRERVGYAAGEGRYKVYIVDEVHRLSAAAFDAFLKTLEEPPPHVIFVFASTEPHKVPATITSRCQRFDFRRIPAEESFERLRFVAGQEAIAVTDDALHIIVQNAGGSLRDALGLLDQVAAFTSTEISDVEVRDALGLADPLLVARLSSELLNGETGKGLREIGSFVDAGGDSRQLLKQLVDYWRALLLQVSGVTVEATTVDPALVPSLADLASRLRDGQVVGVLKALTDADFSPRFNVPSQLPLEVGFVQAALAMNAAPAATHRQPNERSPATGEPRRTDVVRPPVAMESRPSDAGHEQNGNPPDAQVQSTPADAPSEPPSETAQGPVTDMDDAWQRIVAGMRSRSPSLQALLRSGHLLRAENGEITVGFLYDFHKEQLADTKKRKLLEEVVHDVLGVPYRVQCVRATKEEVEAARGADVLPPEDGFVEEVGERLRQVHARRLRSGDSW